MSDSHFGKGLIYHHQAPEDESGISAKQQLSNSITAAYVQHLSRTARQSASPARPRPHSRSPLPPPGRRDSQLPFPGLSLAGAPALVSPSFHPAPRQELVLKQKIQALEDTVAEYERQKFSVMGTFAEYRERVTERERKLEAEYSEKIISLSDEVLAAKKDFENRMKQFQALQEKFEREKEAALETMRAEHQKEIRLMEQRCGETQLLNLEQKYVYEIQRLEEERKSLRSEKERLGDAFDSKLRRAQTLYETELHASKALYSKELETLREHEEALKDELLARQDEFKDRLEEIQEQFVFSKDELERCKAEVEQLELRLKEKQRQMDEISRDLAKVRTVSEESLAKLSVARSELEVTRRAHAEQEEELGRKCQMLAMLETARDKLQAVISDLQIEVRSLRNKVAFLENERANLESQSESQADLQNSQVQALEAVMENLTKEKETTKDHFEAILEQERLAAEEREFGLKKEYAAKISELHSQQHRLTERLEGKAQDEKEQLRDKVVGEYEGRIEDMTKENEQLEAEVERLRTKLFGLLSSGGPKGPGNAALEKELEAAKTQITTLIKKSGAQARELEAARKAADALNECDLHEHHADELEELKRDIRREILSELPEARVEPSEAGASSSSAAFEEELCTKEAQLGEERERAEALTAELAALKDQLAAALKDKEEAVQAAAEKEEATAAVCEEEDEAEQDKQDEAREQLEAALKEAEERKEREERLQETVEELQRTIAELREAKEEKEETKDAPDDLEEGEEPAEEVEEEAEEEEREEDKARVEELERELAEKELLIARLKEQLQGRPELVSTSSSDSADFKDSVEKQQPSSASDSKRSSISSSSGERANVHLCKRATIVDKWHSLVSTLTHEAKAQSHGQGHSSKHHSASNPNSRSGSKTPTAEGGRSGARSMSRVGSPAVSADGSLAVAQGSDAARAKSPRRGQAQDALALAKKGPTPIDKRPAWKF